MKAQRAAVNRGRAKDANMDEFAMMRLAIVKKFLAQKAIEPRYVHVECCQLRSSPPESRIEKRWLRAGELNATRLAYEASMTPVHLPAIEKWSPVPLSYSGVERVRRIELRCLDWRSKAQPIGHTRSGTTFCDAIQLSKTSFEIHSY